MNWNNLRRLAVSACSLYVLGSILRLSDPKFGLYVGRRASPCTRCENLECDICWRYCECPDCSERTARERFCPQCGQDEGIHTFNCPIGYPNE